ncbi:hypothetical protein KUCAC02_031822, partial [Chaenocephalus aceratus]
LNSAGYSLTFEQSVSTFLASRPDFISNSCRVARTRESLFHAGHVTSSALSNMGVSITRRLADMRALPLPSPPR